MIANIDPTIGVVAAAVVGAVGTLIAAMLMSISARQRIGKPNGNGNVIEMLTTIVERHGRLEGEVELTRGMVEANGLAAQAHYADDMRQFTDIRSRLDAET